MLAASSINDWRQGLENFILLSLLPSPISPCSVLSSSVCDGLNKTKAHVETLLRSEAQHVCVRKKKNARGAERNVLNESELIPEQTVCTNDLLSF